MVYSVAVDGIVGSCSFSSEASIKTVEFMGTISATYDNEKDLTIKGFDEAKAWLGV